MNLDGILEVCEALGLKTKRPYTSPKRGEHISISCPLAQWTHQDGEDANAGCSVLIEPDGPSLAKCHSSACAYKGTWYTLVLKAVNRRSPVPPELLKLVEKVAEQERIDLEGTFNRCILIVDDVTKLETVIAAIGQLPENRGPIMRMPTEISRHDRDLLEEVILDQFDNAVPKYVLDRGIKMETAKKWGLRYDRRLWRVVFPVRRMDGKLVGMTGRIIPSHDVVNADGERPTKYHNYSGLNKTRYLYGAHFLRHAIGKPIVLVEGPFDVLKTSQALGDDACVCASLGQGFSPDHRLTIFSAHPSAVYIFADDDIAGRVHAEKIAAQLEDHAGGQAPPLFLMTAKGGKDPGAMTDEAIRAAFEQPVPILGGVVWKPF